MREALSGSQKEIRDTHAYDTLYSGPKRLSVDKALSRQSSQPKKSAKQAAETVFPYVKFRTTTCPNITIHAVAAGVPTPILLQLTLGSRPLSIDVSCLAGLSTCDWSIRHLSRRLASYFSQPCCPSRCSDGASSAMPSSDLVSPCNYHDTMAPTHPIRSSRCRRCRRR